MHIVHYFKRVRLEDGGVVRAILDWCVIMRGRGHRVTLLTFDDTDVPAAWRTGDPALPHVVRIAAPVLPGQCLPRRALASAAEVLRGADVLHLHAIWSPSNNQVARLARRLGVPYIVSVHGMLDDWCMGQRTLKKRLYLALLGRRTLSGARFVHCTAQAELDQARKWLSHDRGVVIPLVFDLEPFRVLPGPEDARNALGLGGGDERPVLLFLSRLHYKKGIPHLIEATARLRDRGMPCLLLVAGSGDAPYMRTLEAQVRDLGLTSDVRFIGFISGTRKVSLYEAADLFVLPTSQENFGFVLPEALACGTPVLTTRGVDIWPELVESGGGVITEPEAGSIADAIEPLLRDPPRRRAMGERGRAWVLEHLDPQRIAGAYERLYETAAVRGATGSPTTSR